MNPKYIVPLGCAIGGGLIYRYLNNIYLNNVVYKDKKIYALMNTYHYNTNIFNKGMFCGLSLGLVYLSFRNFNYSIFKISPDFS